MYRAATSLPVPDSPLMRTVPWLAAMRSSWERSPVMISLPGFGSSKPKPEEASEEVQGLFRMLGIAEDAEYDEVNAAYEALCTKYKGETN